MQLIKKLKSYFQPAQIKFQNQKEIIEQLREAQRRNIVDIDVLTMMEGALQVYDMRVRDIMIPRSNMIIIHRDDKLSDILPDIIESAHSRFPVMSDNGEQVMGLLLAKDLLSYCLSKQKDTAFNIRDLMRTPVFTPESKRLTVLLTEFRRKHNHMAIVVDEYGGVSGLVTIEDVLEQIVGEIEDEHDIEDDAWIVSHDNHYHVKGLTPIREFNDCLNAEISIQDYETIGGCVTKHFGFLPARGEHININGWSFEVIKADGRRIHSLTVRKIPENSEVTLTDAADSGC